MDDDKSPSNPEPEAGTTTGNLFLKRSADEDLVNNNDHRRQRQRVDEDGDEITDDQDPEDMSIENDKKKDEKELKGTFPTNFLNMNIPGRIGDTQNAAEQLQKTIAHSISQLTANITNNSNPKSVQDLAMLQAILQQQQLLQMQILTQMQMQQRSEIKDDKDIEDDGERETLGPQSITDLAKKMELQNTLSSDPKSEADSTPLPPSLPSKSTLANLAAITPNLPMSPTGSEHTGKTQKEPKKEQKVNQVLDPNTGSLASSIIMHHDSPMTNQPSTHWNSCSRERKGF